MTDPRADQPEDVISSIAHLVLSGPMILAVPVAAAAGAVTFLSPCVLPLVPGYVSYVTGMSGAGAERGSRPSRRVPALAGAVAAPTGAGTIAPGAGTSGGPALVPGTGPGASTNTPTPGPARPRTLLGTMLFVLGFSAVFMTEGVAFGGLGSLLHAHSAGLTQILGVMTMILGLMFAGVFDRIPAMGRILRPSVRPRAGLAGAPLLGALFGLGWTPCIGPTLAVVLLLAGNSGTATRGAILMLAYGLGLGIPFLIGAAAFQRSVAAFQFARRHARVITRIGGAMLVAVGVLEVTGVWSAALLWLQQHWIANYQAPL